MAVKNYEKVKESAKLAQQNLSFCVFAKGAKRGRRGSALRRSLDLPIGRFS
jgi:hypothetical protein